MGIFKRKKKQRQNLIISQTYDAEAQKNPQPFEFEEVDNSWTPGDYPISKDFLSFFYGGLEKRAKKLLEASDEGTPDYMDQAIVDEATQALAVLVRMHAARRESISDILRRKKVTLSSHQYELQLVREEKERIGEIVNQIGGFDYE